MPGPSSHSLASLPQQTEQWFQRASAALLGQLPCRPGCIQCCIGPFPVTALDAAAIQEGLKSLTGKERQDILQQASEQAAAAEAAYPVLARSPFLDDWTDTDIDRLATQFQTTPCPALGADGLCRLYDFRPLACRSMGIPEEQAGTVHGACAVQTFVPIIRLSASLRQEEQRLAFREAAELDRCRRTTGAAGDEVLLPYAFLPGLRLGDRAAVDSA